MTNNRTIIITYTSLKVLIYNFLIIFNYPPSSLPPSLARYLPPSLPTCLPPCLPQSLPLPLARSPIHSFHRSLYLSLSLPPPLSPLSPLPLPLSPPSPPLFPPVPSSSVPSRSIPLFPSHLPLSPLSLPPALALSSDVCFRADIHVHGHSIFPSLFCCLRDFASSYIPDPFSRPARFHPHPPSRRHAFLPNMSGFRAVELSQTLSMHALALASRVHRSGTEMPTSDARLPSVTNGVLREARPHLLPTGISLAPGRTERAVMRIDRREMLRLVSLGKLRVKSRRCTGMLTSWSNSGQDFKRPDTRDNVTTLYMRQWSLRLDCTSTAHGWPLIWQSGCRAGDIRRKTLQRFSIHKEPLCSAPLCRGCVVCLSPHSQVTV